MARPFSLPFSSGKMRAMAVALPVDVGARLTRPELLGVVVVVVVVVVVDGRGFWGEEVLGGEVGGSRVC